MIDIEPISSKAHQILVYGEITAEDVARFIAFVQEQNAAQAGGNILFDLVSMASMPLGVMASEVGQLPAMMQWLYRLDRIAIISDEEWIRTAARLESALLPGVSYAVYDADEAERAKAWILEESEHPYTGAVRERDIGPDLAVFELVGRLDGEEAHRYLSRVQEKMADPACSKLMVVIRKWHGFDVDAAFSGKVLQSKAGLIDQIDRYALVGGPGWLRQMAGAVGAMIKPQVRTFDLEDEAAALAWLRE
ncbi:MAG: STAS/SEC14 domain-containing protein [Erythrobacter sp.]